MKVLFITQKVDINDDVLGAYHAWIAGLAREVDQVQVICLEKRHTDLPANVQVFSLGKEEGKTRATYVFRFFSYILRLRKTYDVVFVHMNPEYVTLGGIFWRLLGKKIFLWYAHPAYNLRLASALLFTDVVVTSVRSAFPARHRHIEVVGQGINTDLFSPVPKSNQNDKAYTILCVGRIARVKNLETLIGAVSQLRGLIHTRKIRCVFVGSSSKKDAAYAEELRQAALAHASPHEFQFLGSIPNRHMAEVYQGADVCVNLTSIGFFDKTILEAMACGKPVLVANREFKNIFPPEVQPLLLFQPGNVDDLADKIEALLLLDEERRAALGLILRSIVLEKHNLTQLMSRLARLMSLY
jgi:glycosyltransferase involved in cell wall biosynthesis